MKPTLSVSLQQEILILLMFTEHAEYARGMIDLINFTADSSILKLAEAIYNYIDTYKEAPKTNIWGLIDDLKKVGVDETEQRILRSMVKALEDQAREFNLDYVYTRLQAFHKDFVYRDGIQRGIELVNQGKFDELGELFSSCMKSSLKAFDPGDGFLDWMVNRQFQSAEDPKDFVNVRIPPLDSRQVHPRRGTVTMLLAPTKTGKSFWCVHVSASALLEGKRVLYISLELGKETIKKRFAQHIFGATNTTQLPTTRTTIVGPSLNPVGFGTAVSDRPSFDDPKFLKEKIEIMKGSLNRLDRNLRIVRFPNKQLSFTQMRSYVDSLELHGLFVPDLTVIDMADGLKLSGKDVVEETSELFAILCGWAVERNMMLITPSQVNRVGIAGHKKGGPGYNIEATDIRGAFDKVCHVDCTIVYNQTRRERELGMARLLVDASRDSEDKFEVLIEQNLATAQFCINSADYTKDMRSKWEKILKDDQSK